MSCSEFIPCALCIFDNLSLSYIIRDNISLSLFLFLSSVSLWFSFKTSISCLYIWAQYNENERLVITSLHLSYRYCAVTKKYIFNTK